MLQLFADKGIIAIEHADFDGNEMLALVGYTNIEVFKVIWNVIVWKRKYKPFQVTGGEIVPTFNKPVKMAWCDLIEQVI